MWRKYLSARPCLDQKLLGWHLAEVPVQGAAAGRRLAARRVLTLGTNQPRLDTRLTLVSQLAR